MESVETFRDYMAQQPSPLPEFDNPPVSEVVLSVEFLPIEHWRSPHAGLYWSLISGEYPETEVQPPLPSQIEKFGEANWQRPEVQIQFANPDVNRFWFVAKPGTRLIQIQRDRFIVNWRKVLGNEPYPRYEKEMRPRFEREWRQFKSFISDRKLGAIDVQQCEITYVNDIIKGEGWNNMSQALELFAHWLGRGSDNFLPSPETLSIAGSFLMPEERGRLHFATQHVIRQTDQQQAIQLRLVARGKPQSSDDRDILSWMDESREWIVRGFTDLTSPKAHKLWKRRI
jgi:uncharacterized protein (TIGR04255 family)